jgi:hypothetical protein
VAGPPDLGRRARERLLARLRTQRYDLLVVGGGINGAGIARDAAGLPGEGGCGAPRVAASAANAASAPNTARDPPLTTPSRRQ